MKKFARALLPVVLAVSFIGTPAFAWGKLGHQLIMKLMIQLANKNSPMGAFLNLNSELMTRNVIVPDEEWKQGEHKDAEGPLHFWQPDAYIKDGKVNLDAIAALEIGPEYKKLIAKFAQLMVNNIDYINSTQSKKRFDPQNLTAKQVYDFGTLPWRVGQMFHETVAALKAHDFERAALMLGAAGHYIGDAFMPYHGALNYNPSGIHSVYEEQILEWRAHDLEDKVDHDAKIWDPKNMLKEITSKFGDLLTKPPADNGDSFIRRICNAFGTGFPMRDPLLAAWKTVMAKFSVGRAPAGDHHPPPPPKEAIKEFAQMPIELPGINGKLSVLDSAYRRIAEAAVLLDQFTKAVYEEASKEDPTLAKALAEKPQLEPFNAAFAIRNFPAPDYLPKPDTPAGECGPEFQLLNPK